MKLLIFNEANLRRTPFIKQFVSEFHQFKDKTILLHAPFGKPRDTFFVTKRISSLLSEVLVVNMALSGDQKGLLNREAGELKVDVNQITHKFKTLQMVVMNTIVGGTDGEMASVAEVAQLLRQELPIEETLVFYTNSMSPVAAEKKLVEGNDDIADLLKVYDEEAPALEQAASLAPAWLVSASNFAK